MKGLAGTGKSHVIGTIAIVCDLREIKVVLTGSSNSAVERAADCLLEAIEILEDSDDENIAPRAKNLRRNSIIRYHPSIADKLQDIRPGRAEGEERVQAAGVK